MCCRRVQVLASGRRAESSSANCCWHHCAAVKSVTLKPCGLKGLLSRTKPMSSRSGTYTWCLASETGALLGREVGKLSVVAGKDCWSLFDVSCSTSLSPGAPAATEPVFPSDAAASLLEDLVTLPVGGSGLSSAVPVRPFAVFGAASWLSADAMSCSVSSRSSADHSRESSKTFLMSWLSDRS